MSGYIGYPGAPRHGGYSVFAGVGGFGSAGRGIPGILDDHCIETHDEPMMTC